MVSFQDINKQTNDVILLEVCKELLSEGRLDCFEYICSYVMQYDTDFIQPYLQRYSASDFTCEELSQVGDISTDYITKKAQWAVVGSVIHSSRLIIAFTPSVSAKPERDLTMPCFIS